MNINEGKIFTCVKKLQIVSSYYNTFFMYFFFHTREKQTAKGGVFF